MLLAPIIEPGKVDKSPGELGSSGFSTDITTKVILLQLKELGRQIPAMMVICIVMLVAVVMLTHDAQNSIALSIWALLLSGSIGFSLWAWWITPKKVINDASLYQVSNWLLLNTLAFGSLFGLLPMALQSNADGNYWLIYGAAVAVAVGVAGFSLTSVPKSIWAFMSPIFLSSTYYAVQNQSWAGGIFVALLLVYMAFSLWKSSDSTKSLYMRTKAREKIKEQEATIGLLLRDFVENSSDWLWETDQNFSIINASERFSSAAGLELDKLNGTKIKSLVSNNSEELSILISAFVESIQNKLAFHDITIPIEVNNKEMWWSITGKPTYDENNQFIGFRGVCSDITIQKRAEDRVQFLAHNDALTGLANRTYFTNQLNYHVSRLERYGSPFSVLYVDLDQFKAINDTKGHPFGDRILEEVGRRLRAVVRESDVLARIGGDEFAILTTNVDSENNEAHLAQRIIDTLSTLYDIDGEKAQLGASIGIAKAPINGTRPDQIQRNTDLALYRAKHAGKGCYQFFEAEMDSQARERRTLESELRDALHNEEFELYYQPLLDVSSETPTGFEALIRWNHPIRGTVSPGEFIPLAESIGVIQKIGEWAIYEACNTATSWPNNLTIAVNLSVHQFENDSILEVVKGALEHSKLDASRLELEITESVLIDNPDGVIETLVALKKLGVAIAMDDFGTGYSSLSYLMKFPFDKMKIDREFVIDLETDSVARSVLKTISALGDSLNMKITVEGVETKEQVDFLSKVSCHQLQGFFFAKPLQKQDLPGYLLKQQQKTLQLGSKSSNVSIDHVGNNTNSPMVPLKKAS